MKTIVVKRIDPHSGRTVTLGHGREVGTPQNVTFAGEPRMMEVMRQALAQVTDEKIVVLVEDWQIVGGSN